ncbi:hypothetical protein [Pectobacterium brasiliense]|uniref:hypothetical protein n=1 Tax=Pectobacterium brasiliense TaxID=180957 RepID=UPI001968E4F2|nr:hypothetical protein [Pectobacterium brasiliense]MBN3263510.1 hypothetical protein [Pectobacterium brasiliense]
MAITYEYHYGNGGFILSEPQQKELRTLLDKQLTQSGTGAKSLAVPLYDKILSYLPVPSINVGEYFKVYTWAASHASNMDQLVDQDVQLHSEIITDRFTLPTSSDLWYA